MNAETPTQGLPDELSQEVLDAVTNQYRKDNFDTTMGDNSNYIGIRSGHGSDTKIGVYEYLTGTDVTFTPEELKRLYLRAVADDRP